MHIETVGQGPHLVLVHGWSMHSAVWHDLIPMLATDFTLHLVDLPGHGKSEWQAGDFELDSLLETLHQQLPEQVAFLGWSLGGLLGLLFTQRYRQQVTRLTLLAATPCFVQKADWSSAMATDVLNQFASQLHDNQKDTLQRFLLLQARGSNHSRETIRMLAQQLTIAQPPNSDALAAGLAVLINTDSRQQLAEIMCPIQIILGQRDTLIPQTMLAAVKQLNPRINTHLITGAGHAPFISHPTECYQLINSFLTATVNND